MFAQEVHQQSVQGSIGRGFKHNRHGAEVGWHRFRVHRDALRKILRSEHQRTTKVSTTGINQRCKTIATGDVDLLPVLAVPLDAWN